MKKFLVIVTVVAAVFVAWSDTASAQCGNVGFFGRSQCNSGQVFGRRFFHPAPVYHSVPTYNNFSGCNSSGCVVVGQPQYVEGVKKTGMPAPYTGDVSNPAPVPQANQQEDIPLPPKKIQPPNPRQEGFPGGANIQIEGEYYGRLPSGDYAKISDGTYSRLMGNTAYGSYSK